MHARSSPQPIGVMGVLVVMGNKVHIRAQIQAPKPWSQFAHGAGSHAGCIALVMMAVPVGPIYASQICMGKSILWCSTCHAIGCGALGSGIDGQAQSSLE